jgi:hypothetical protein
LPFHFGIDSKETAETSWHFEERIDHLMAEYAHFKTVARVFSGSARRHFSLAASVHKKSRDFAVPALAE